MPFRAVSRAAHRFLSLKKPRHMPDTGQYGSPHRSAYSMPFRAFKKKFNYWWENKNLNKRVNARRNELMIMTMMMSMMMTMMQWWEGDRQRQIVGWFLSWFWPLFFTFVIHIYLLKCVWAAQWHRSTKHFFFVCFGLIGILRHLRASLSVQYFNKK